MQGGLKNSAHKEAQFILPQASTSTPTNNFPSTFKYQDEPSDNAQEFPGDAGTVPLPVESTYYHPILNGTAFPF